MNAAAAVGTCPSWCVEGTAENPCRGDHYGDSEYVPATAGEPERVGSMCGAQFVAVGVGVKYCEMDGLVDPAVFIHLSGASTDADVDLRGHEARRIAALLIEAADRLEREAGL
jgi:hypothetical protein